MRVLLGVVPYVLLAVLAVVTVAIFRSEGVSPVFELTLCALAAGWILGVHTLRPAWRTRPAVMAVFVGVLVVILGALVVRAPWFGFFVPIAYVFAFRLLLWPGRLAGVAAVSVVAGTAQAHALDPGTQLGLFAYLLVVAANVLPLCCFAWFSHRAAQRNEERVRALDEAREANRRLAESMAENAALHEQLVAQAKDAGVHEERERMAREIHDTLAQGFTGIISQLRAAEEAGDDPAGWRRHLTVAGELARESLNEARRSVAALRPEPLRTARLGEALSSVADRWSALHEIPVQVTATGAARPIPPEAEVALLRAAQEALTNVAKHARATRVGVTLSYLDDEVALDVRDDGSGFEPEPEPGPGFGLVAMRQRVEGLAGSLRIESEPGVGTGISARVPVS